MCCPIANTTQFQLIGGLSQEHVDDDVRDISAINIIKCNLVLLPRSERMMRMMRMTMRRKIEVGMAPLQLLLRLLLPPPLLLALHSVGIEHAQHRLVSV